MLWSKFDNMMQIKFKKKWKNSPFFPVFCYSVYIKYLGLILVKFHKIKDLDVGLDFEP